MNENKNKSFDVSLNIVSKGRSLDGVLNAYMTMYKNAWHVAEQSGATGDEIFAKAMLGSVYRIYLLGVED